MARRQDDEIEVWFDRVTHGDQPSAPGQQGRTWPWIAGAAALAIGAGTVVFARGDDRGASPASPTTVVQEVTQTSPSTTLASPSTAPPPLEDGAVIGPVQPLGLATGLVIYLATLDASSDESPSQLLAYHLDTGQVHYVDTWEGVGRITGVFDAAGGLVVDGSEELALVSLAGVLGLGRSYDSGLYDTSTQHAAPGPAGTLWLRAANPGRLVLLDATGSPTGIEYPLPLGSDLYGSLANGRPVVRGGNQRSFVINVDGSRTPLATGITSAVDRGEYVEIVCGRSEFCTVAGHLPNGATIDLGAEVASGMLGPPSFRLQPDGPYVAIVRDGSLALVNTRTGDRTADILRDSSLFGPAGLTDKVRFLPGTGGLVVQTSSGLAFVDLSGRVVATAEIDVAGVPPASIVGVGLQRTLDVNARG